MKKEISLFIVITFLSCVLALAQEPRQGTNPVAESTKAMVSTSHPFVTKSMLAVLRKGGNAVDAMITGVLLQTVIEPQMVTIAGGLCMLFYEAKSGQYHYLNAECDIARKDTGKKPRMQVAVPGTIKGLWAAHKRFGTLNWKDYFIPAIKTAREGFKMYDFLYAYLIYDANILAKHKSAEEIWLPDGFPIGVGEIVKRPALAKTLERIANEGPDYFYTGEFAKKIINGSKEAGTELTLEELENYKVRWQEPLHFNYRGNELIGPPPPSYGGIYLAMMLNALETVDLKKMGHYSKSGETMSFIARVMNRVSTDVHTFVKDPFLYELPTSTLMSKDYARMISNLIRNSKPKSPTTPNIKPIEENNSEPPDSDTCHQVIWDTEGNIVSLTHTDYGHSGVFVDGVHLNGAGGRGEGRRIVSPVSPIIIVKDGKPWIVLGTPGNPPPYELIVIVNLLDFRMDLNSAIDAPRVSTRGNILQAENRFDPKVWEELKRLGISVVNAGAYNWHFGSIQVIRLEDGKLYGAADPRRCGWAEGLK